MSPVEILAPILILRLILAGIRDAILPAIRHVILPNILNNNEYPSKIAIFKRLEAGYK